jgi:hypothetical protein
VQISPLQTSQEALNKSPFTVVQGAPGTARVGRNHPGKILSPVAAKIKKKNKGKAIPANCRLCFLIYRPMNSPKIKVKN